MYLPSKVFLSTSTNFQFNFLFLSFKLFDFYFAHFDIELFDSHSAHSDIEFCDCVLLLVIPNVNVANWLNMVLSAALPRAMVVGFIKTKQDFEVKGMEVQYL